MHGRGSARPKGRRGPHRAGAQSAGAVAEGVSNQVIAARLFVTDRTVEAHISANFHKRDLGESPDFGGRRRRVFTQLAALSGARPGDRVLDVGCGTGAFTRVMAEADTFRGTVLGVDPSREVIARARRLTRHADCTLEGIAEALDAPDGSYDVVVSSLMIHHLPERLRPQATREIFRVLRPGGRVLIADFRPPTSRIGRHLIGHVASPAMPNNPVHLLEPIAREAGFDRVRNGDATRGSGTYRVRSHSAPQEHRTGLRPRWHLDADRDRPSTRCCAAETTETLYAEMAPRSKRSPHPASGPALLRHCDSHWA
jgi:SAM-dependent methyltransferase